MKMIHLYKCAVQARPYVQGDGNAGSRCVSPGLYDHGINHVIREGGKEK